MDIPNSSGGLRSWRAGVRHFAPALNLVLRMPALLVVHSAGGRILISSEGHRTLACLSTVRATCQELCLAHLRQVPLFAACLPSAGHPSLCGRSPYLRHYGGGGPTLTGVGATGRPITHRLSRHPRLRGKPARPFRRCLRSAGATVTLRRICFVCVRLRTHVLCPAKLMA